MATWASEQAIREIYLKPFEMIVKNAKNTISYISDNEGTVSRKEMSAATALMSSFNRIGAVWTGGSIPHFLIRGTKDPLITDASVQAYTDALKAAGQTAEYVQVQGASHAFYDWKPDKATQATFAAYGVPGIHKMLAFFDRYL